MALECKRRKENCWTRAHFGHLESGRNIEFLVNSDELEIASVHL